jgi:thiamine-monophosphate kinase
MTSEPAFIVALRRLATAEGARGFLDDAAVLAPPVGRDLVLTKDMIVEGVHYLPYDPPGDVAWKLLAVNLSDLAAKGAKPIGVLLGYMLAGDSEWDQAFVDGLGRALTHFNVRLLGGDTVSAAGARTLSLTAVGEASRPVPDRRCAKAGDALWVTGTIGDAGAGLRIARGDLAGPRRLPKRYRLPMPRLKEGHALAPHVLAMSDISDGLLIDAARMAEASGLAVEIDLDAVPLSPDFAEAIGTDRDARLFAATSGDDYELLVAATPDRVAQVALPPKSLHRVGFFTAGSGMSLRAGGEVIALPVSLGFVHGNRSHAD